MRKALLSSILLLFGSLGYSLKAQNDISDIFKSGVEDLNKVAEGYLAPAGNAFAAGMGSNWYNTADTHKLLGFDLRIGINGTQIPVADQMFSLAGLTNLKTVDPNVTQAPTFGGSGDGVELRLMQPHYLKSGSENPLYDNGNGVITSFTTPSGFTRYVPSASIQLTLGLPLNNDLMVRFVPTIKTSGVETSLWGVGLKNNFKEFIPFFKYLPFNLSALVAYNQFDISYAFPNSAQVTPDKLVSGDLEYVPDPQSNDYTTQGMRMSTSSLTANVIISKNLILFTPYLGVGFIRTNFDLTMVGNYPTLGDPVDTGGGEYKMQIINMTDPISISSSQVMPGATLGLRLKFLGIIAAHAQYTFQKYPTASIGFGIGIR
ncbi:MAG: hypothetical protein M0P26_00405 [Bacteroidales bacterium]|nr:hypothetical protein [Bacteroidales bacterium]